MRGIKQVKHPFVDAQARIRADVEKRQRQQREHLRGKAHAKELITSPIQAPPDHETGQKRQGQERRLAEKEEQQENPTEDNAPDEDEAPVISM